MSELKRNVCDEAPVDLHVNGRKLVTFMCTPTHLNELALGYLISRGLITGQEQVMALAACDDLRKIHVNIAQPITEEQYGLASVLASGCGSDSVLSEEFLGQSAIETDFHIPLSRLHQLIRQMFDEAALYKETGGVHCAALADAGGLRALREDVGRHNAVDKVIGKGILLGLNFGQTAILTTGRISSDMVLKAVAGGFPVVASRSIPTSLALEIAERMGITIVGRLIGKDPLIYSHPERIICEDKVTA